MYVRLLCCAGEDLSSEASEGPKDPMQGETTGEEIAHPLPLRDCAEENPCREAAGPAPPAFSIHALAQLQEIITQSQWNMIEDFGRANKGEHFVLQFLAMRNQESLPSELSAALKASSPRISALLGTLEKKGYISRRTDRSNRRNVLVNITDEGRRHIQSKTREMDDILTHVFLDMGEEDTKEFIRLNKCFFKALQKQMNAHCPQVRQKDSKAEETAEA